MHTELPRTTDATVELAGWREQIDGLDEKILELLNQRSALSIAIAGVKRERGLPVVDVRRELAVIERLTNLSDGPLDMARIQLIFCSIFEASRSIQSEVMAADK